ncbi:glycoside hydrolase superfamily [Radiomyces spectabilis]|uniref:glycoside hydrolase superfamily n=1 Tax=Radiomyces spectabilis TaxID=64574 RepID=UPI00221FAD3B|nr:glycoside hydrolase superfamily [Radiomyces spectabilis]KAI8378038.1 glycoside hydrolase superfamily [Radiomyces spectabilis]
MVTDSLEAPHLSFVQPCHAAQEWNTEIRHSGRWFKDSTGRTLLMRGVNVCGSSKLPTHPYPGSTHLYDEKLFWDHRGVSFVGRPFPLKEADEHFNRLRAWGLTLIRFLVPWEALEHQGPGQYDEEYIDYLRELIALMPKYGLKCMIDPHQDTWSRFSGGSGAPGWTFEVAGMNIRNFKETGAAYVHNTNAVPGDPLPMVWPTNYTKLASCTMFTLFFGGDTFAAEHTYQGGSIQQFLQKSFIQAFQHLAKRLVDLSAVMGFEVMNEPHPGYIGLPTLREYDPIVNLIFGDSPSPLQSFALGDGIPQEVGVYIKSWPFPTKRSHTRTINASRTSAWLADQSCIWKQHGVWKLDDAGQPVLLDDAYFSKDPITGETVDFYRDFYVPFVNQYAQAIQSVKKIWYCFVEPLANERSPIFTEKDHHDHMVYAPHWYDLNCVFYKKFNGLMTHDVQSLQNGGNVLGATYFGRNGAKKNYRGQIRNIKESGLQNMGEKPCLLGEVGIPMDLNERLAFDTGDYSYHVHFMDAVIYALETNLVNFTLWNYDVCNDNEYGDHWNGENFSIYSSPRDDAVAGLTFSTDDADLHTRLHNGGRVLDAAVVRWNQLFNHGSYGLIHIIFFFLGPQRPYASKVAGTPTVSEFNMDALEYTLTFQPFSQAETEEQIASGFDANDTLATVTEIFIPAFHYKDVSLDIQASSGECHYAPDRQTVYHVYERGQGCDIPDVITIKIKSNKSTAEGTCSIM